MSIFANRKNKKGSVLNIDVLERIIEQDSFDYANSAYSDNNVNEARKLQYCGLTSEGQRRLSKAITTKNFSQKDICVRSEKLLSVAKNGNWVAEIEGSGIIFPPVIKEAYDYESCKTLSESKAYWDGSSCMVRMGTNENISDDTCCNTKDTDDKPIANTSCKEENCGKDYYWNGISVVKATADKDVCELRNGTWFDKAAAEAKKYKPADGCCKCSGSDTKCQDSAKICEEDSGSN
jgi:hypothetical protein